MNYDVRAKLDAASGRLPGRAQLVGVCAAVVMLVWTAGCAPATVPAPAPADPPVAATDEEGPAATGQATEASAQEAAPTPEKAQAEEEAAAILVPTATAVTEPGAAVATETDWANTVTVEGDYFIRGNPAAPVRLIDYSDFL